MRFSQALHLAFLFASALHTNGQALLILPSTDDPDLPVFNERFIARNGIASIVGERLVKRDGEPMIPGRERLLYKFDEQGRQVYSNHSYGQPGTGRDTASVMYYRDEQGRVNRRLRNDLGGHFAYAMELDDKGRVTRETYQRIENLGSNRYELKPGATFEISDERFRYAELNDTTLRRSYLNNLDLPYREQTFISNRRGYLLRIEEHYLVSNRRGRIEFNYDESGRLSERMEQPDLAQARTTRHRWAHDAAGNVISGEYWINDRQVNRDEYAYEEGTMLLKARVRKDLSTGTIHVLKFTMTRR